jgi:uncharacterized phage protein (TIGR01671 family)
MRKLKFRCWNKKENKMIIPDLYNCEYYIAEGELIIGETIEYGTHEDFNIFEIMQFMGLLDKNRKEVYEGDFVIVPEGYGGDYRYNEYVGVITYDAPEFYIIPRGNTHYGQDFSWKEIEVIGNIYENPELLK